MDPELITLLQELMATWDSTIDTSEGSSFYTTVLTPFLTRVGPSLLGSDLEDLLAEYVNERLGINTSPNSRYRETLTNPVAVMFAPLQREIEQLKLRGSPENYESLTREEVNADLSRYFLTLDDGETVTGTVRVYFVSPRSVTFATTSRFSTPGGLGYVPSSTQSITSTTMQFNREGELYYVDVDVQAEASGDTYNVEAGEITRVEGIAGAYRVSNRFAMSNGTPSETKTEARTRAEDSITIRTLSTARGIRTVIRDTFSNLRTEDIEVVRKGDPEMERDIIRGPVAIADIPGGFAGITAPSIPADGVHVGGMTDVYVHQTELTQLTLDIQNITDKGQRVWHSESGEVDASAGPTDEFGDAYGLFQTRGVLVGDFLRIDGSEYEILIVADDVITVDNTFTTTLSGTTYEIVRYEDSDDIGPRIVVRLDDLIALTSDGEPYFDTDGDPVQPVPGDPDYAGLLSSGTPVKKTENIADTNIELPLAYVEGVEFLDSLSLQPTNVSIPLAEVLLIQAADDFTGGTVSTKASGFVRVFTRDATNLAFILTIFSFGGVSFQIDPSTRYTGSANAQVTGAGSIIKILGVDLTSTIQIGDRLVYSGGYYMVTGTVLNGSDTDVTVRESFSGAVAAASFAHYVGTREQDSTYDSTTGLYYADIAVEALNNGVNGNLSEGDVLTSDGITVEGYTIRNQYDGISHSTREMVNLQLTRWVNDSTDLLAPSTAYAMRLVYRVADNLVDVQALADSDEQRQVAEDLLVRHHRPALVRLPSVVVSGITAAEAKTALVDYIKTVQGDDNLEISDLAGVLRDAGADYTQMPMRAVVYHQAFDRSWSGQSVTNRVSLERIDYFIPDEDAITVTLDS